MPHLRLISNFIENRRRSGNIQITMVGLVQDLHVSWCNSKLKFNSKLL